MICHDFLMKNVAFCIEKMIKIVSIFSWSKLSGFGRSKFWLYLNNRKLIYIYSPFHFVKFNSGRDPNAEQTIDVEIFFPTEAHPQNY